MKYKLEYDFLEFATVEIDHALADPVIKEMVEFWMDWQDKLEANDGDYTATWLKMLGARMLRTSEIPYVAEGWQISAEFGIKISDFTPWNFEEDEIQITPST